MASNLQRYVLKRIVQAVPVFLFVTVVIFGLMHAAPGNPARIMLGPKATESAVSALERKWGLNQPLYIQYLSWLSNVVVGDFGTSLSGGQEVSKLLAERLPVTLTLAFFSMVVSLIIAIPAGILSAVKKNTSVDYVAMIFALVGVSMPNFWLGLMLIVVFGLWLGWLPTFGYTSLFADPVKGLQQLVLPSIALGTALAAVVTRMLRSSMLDVMGEDYIQTARAKGISRRKIIRKHALRNALIPTVTVIGLQIGYLMNGSILVETVFAIPGMGRLLANGVFQRNFPVVQGTVIVIALIFIAVNLLVDLVYAYLDPQISYD
jgi:peptide/nickel transport system permease protein